VNLVQGQREKLKGLYFTLLRLAGQEGRLYARIKRARAMVVLNLHQVRPRPNPFWSPLHPLLFDELLQFVAKRFFVTTFGGHTRNDTDKPSLILSFDDGFHDYVEYSLPLLRKYRLPSNQNVIGETLETGAPPKVVRVSDFLGQAPFSLLKEIRLPGFTTQLTGDSEREKIRFGQALFVFLKMRPHNEAAPLWDEMDRFMARLDYLPSRMMSVSDVQEAARDHEIGGHSFSHDSMGFETDEYFQQDFHRAATIFRDRLNVPLTIYSFPNGSHRPAQTDWLHSHGVDHVLLAGDDFQLNNGRTYQRFNYYANSTDEVRIRALGHFARRSLSA
jgi:peptidoglycan/xylan/chitin deacetylase (PgdA/CDA1 family)